MKVVNQYLKTNGRETRRQGIRQTRQLATGFLPPTVLPVIPCNEGDKTDPHEGQTNALCSSEH